MTETTMVEITKGNKRYNAGKPTEVRALRDVDLTIRQGELIAVTGPSGSGKSTLLHILAGLDTLTSGSYCYRGQEMAQLRDRERCRLRNEEIAIILQDFGLLESDTVEQNLCLPHIIGGRMSRSIREDVKRALAHVGLEGLEKKPVHQLSGGQRQRVAIARALTMNARLILADEPTGALDSHHTEELMELLKDLNRSGVTILIVTHNAYVASQCPVRYEIVDGTLFPAG